ncbi:hypothetical protein P7K49_038829 [Saguinus oedipus]|uniref:Centromere protein I n=1 Tax=Saguinus oedipus TaxID=9490 RepID=A0ABQ9TFR8_SAGOE|nr:hypothetical protein P7K49_038829 [Saguinus oedipus]
MACQSRELGLILRVDEDGFWDSLSIRHEPVSRCIKQGMQPHLQALLSLYKFFAPALISVSLPVRKKNSENLWKTALLAVKQRNQRPSPEPLKLMLGTANVRPLKRLPSQMGSVLNSSLLLHYINCVRDEPVLLRFYYWLSQTLQEEVKPLLFDRLAQLFFTSTIYFKCSVLQSLKELLQNWLLWLSMDIHMKPVTNSPLETTLGGSMNSVSKLIHYVGYLSTTAMRLESNSTFLLHFILDFYEKVCDIYINYNLPLVVLFPPGIFYSALLSLDASILNQLCFIMHRASGNQKCGLLLDMTFRYGAMIAVLFLNPPLLWLWN